MAKLKQDQLCLILCANGLVDLPEATITEIAATFSETAVKQINNELREAVKQRPKIVTEIGKLLMPSKADKISAVGTKPPRVI